MTFNNGCVKLFIYSPLLPSSLLSSVCLLCFLSLEKRATWREGRGGRVRLNLDGERYYFYIQSGPVLHTADSPQVTCCRRAAVFLPCCDTVSSSLALSGSRCLLSGNERVWFHRRGGWRNLRSWKCCSLGIRALLVEAQLCVTMLGTY